MPATKSHRGRPHSNARSVRRGNLPPGVSSASTSVTTTATDVSNTGNSRRAARGRGRRLGSHVQLGDAIQSASRAATADSPVATHSSSPFECSREELLSLIREEFRALQQQQAPDSGLHLPESSLHPTVSLPLQPTAEDPQAGSCLILCYFTPQYVGPTYNLSRL